MFQGVKMKIPDTYSADNADYLTIPSMKMFCSKHNLKINVNRRDLINTIEEFASKNDLFNEITQQWLEKTLKAGMKTCLIKKIYYNGIMDNNFINSELIRAFPNANKKHLCEFTPSDTPEMVSYFIKHDNNKVINIQITFLCRMLRVADTYSNTGSIIIYPVYVDIDFETGFCILRSKAISGLFNISNGNEANPKYKSSAEKMMIKCEEIIREIIGYNSESDSISKKSFKYTIFNILEEYTKTPEVIQEKINRSSKKCHDFAKLLFQELGIPITLEIMQDAKYDMEIFVEKYASITYPDDKIFIKDRMAYPIKFLAQDNEFTKIQESSSGADVPLQRKKAFFDSKKAVYTDKKCDKICLCHMRQENTKKYYGDNPYEVQIYLHSSFCAVKFLRFVEEDDIQYVLSRIIQLYNVRE